MLHRNRIIWWNKLNALLYESIHQVSWLFFISTYYDLESSEKKKPQMKKVFQLDLVVGKPGGHFLICN